MAEKDKKNKAEKKVKRNWSGRLFWCFGWVLCLLSVIGLFGASAWPCDLAANFRLQYAVLLLLYFGAAVWYLRWLTMFACGSALLLNVILLLPFLVYPADGHGKYKLMAANIDYENRDFPRVEKVILQEQPDFLVMVEVRSEWRKLMPKLADAFPYAYESLETKPSRIVILSRFPAQSRPLRTWDYNPGLFAEMKLEGRNFTLVGIHPSSPKPHRDHQDRKLQYQQLAYFFTQVPKGELMVAGDFNASPWSYYFRILTSRVEFKSAMAEFGLHLTYPAGWNPFGVPIDHCVYTSGIVLKAFRRAADLGSDHYPVVVEFDLRPLPAASPVVSTPVVAPGVAAPR